MQAPIVITKETLSHIMAAVGSYPAETGGIIAERDGIICGFYFDQNAKGTQICYTPSVKDLARVVNEEWLPKGLRLCGIVHSHREPSPPSKKDLRSAALLMELNGMERFFMPIVAAGEIVFHELSGGEVTERGVEAV